VANELRLVAFVYLARIADPDGQLLPARSGLGKQLTYKEVEAIILRAGMTKRDIKNVELMGALPEG